MRFSYTDGTTIDIPDMCAYCNMDTGGNHEPHCPFFDDELWKIKTEQAELKVKIEWIWPSEFIEKGEENES